VCGRGERVNVRRRRCRRGNRAPARAADDAVEPHQDPGQPPSGRRPARLALRQRFAAAAVVEVPLLGGELTDATELGELVALLERAGW
jgi:hypothetical protein